MVTERKCEKEAGRLCNFRPLSRTRIFPLLLFVPLLSLLIKWINAYCMFGELNKVYDLPLNWANGAHSRSNVQY